MNNDLDLQCKLQERRLVLVAANHLTLAAEVVERLQQELSEAQNLLELRRREVVEELERMETDLPEELTKLEFGGWKVDIDPDWFDHSPRSRGISVYRNLPERRVNIGEAIAQIDRQVAQARVYADEPATDAPVEVAYEEQPKADCGCNPKQKEACRREIEYDPAGPVHEGCRNA